MARSIAVGIDIGTYQVRVVVTSANTPAERISPKIIGVGSAESRGLRHGYIINQAEAVKSIRNAIRQAEKAAGIKITRAFLAVGGIGLSSVISTGTIVTSRADSEITDIDVKKAQEVAEHDIPQTVSINRRILHPIPLEFRIDGKSVLGRPNNMKGMRLEAKMLFITCLSHHLDDLIEAVQECEVDVEDVMASPLAASFVTLSKTQRIAGCVLANIGAETVSIVVFENDKAISMEVFPIGSNDITNDIALGLKIPIEQAERIKIGLQNQAGGNKIQDFPRKKLDEIVGARLSDIFELIEAHLKKINRNGLLPAGIIITGGGSSIATIEDLAKSSLKLPSRRPDVRFDSAKGAIKDSGWAVAYGLCIVAFTTDESEIIGMSPHLRHIVKGARNSIWGWIKQFLP